MKWLNIYIINIMTMNWWLISLNTIHRAFYPAVLLAFFLFAVVSDVVCFYNRPALQGRRAPVPCRETRLSDTLVQGHTCADYLTAHCLSYSQHRLEPQEVVVASPAEAWWEDHREHRLIIASDAGIDSWKTQGSIKVIITSHQCNKQHLNMVKL